MASGSGRVRVERIVPIIVPGRVPGAHDVRDARNAISEELLHPSPRNVKALVLSLMEAANPVFSSSQSTESLTLQFGLTPTPAPATPSCSLFSNPSPEVLTFGRPLTANCPPYKNLTMLYMLTWGMV